MTLVEEIVNIDLIEITVGDAGHAEPTMYGISGEKCPLTHETKNPMYYEHGQKA